MLSSEFNLKEKVDSVVMLTWSDWFTEPISNRYHYATRFSKHLPVIFVQPDMLDKSYRYEETNNKNITILHIYCGYDQCQIELLNKALLERGIIKPLLWIYNTQFVDYIITRYSPIKVYHATEDYFLIHTKDDYRIKKLKDNLRRTLLHVELVVAVSERVLDSYKNNCSYKGNAIVASNGCDFGFWGLKDEEKNAIISSEKRKIAFYQGGINSRMDYDLLMDIANQLSDWEIWLCGRVGESPVGWNRLLKQPNIKYFGDLSIEEVRKLSIKAAVALIPFKQSPLIENSLPLKAFEYLACGLPVVSVPIKALEGDKSEFYFSKTSDEFITGINAVAESRYDLDSINRRLGVAAKEDYDLKFTNVLRTIENITKNNKDMANNDGRLNILILFDMRSLHVLTIREHLESYVKYSTNNIFYADACNNAICEIDLSYFDIVVLHYSVRVSLKNHLSPSYADAIKGFGGFKILYIQDDYENTEQARIWINELGINLVYTVVPSQYINIVYPAERFPYVAFLPTLTGFVPTTSKPENELKKISDRKTVIGYRGRPLPYWYGDLGQEKLIIGQKMRKICIERSIPCNIEWEEDKRIYGSGWLDFVESCRATLGTESGSNVFDDYDNIKNAIIKKLAENPEISYEEIFDLYLAEHEGKVIMNQVSPKMFEAISLKTALILFEGSYSNILKPEVHFIELKKDFSNIDEVLDKAMDCEYLQNLVDGAYLDICGSEKYTYKQFIKEFDKTISFIESRDFYNLEVPRKLKKIIGKSPSFENKLIKSSDNIIKKLLSSEYYINIRPRLLDILGKSPRLFSLTKHFRNRLMNRK